MRAITPLLCLFVLSAHAAPPQVIGGVQDSYPHLSPDGTQVVFHSNRTGSRQVWIMNADGSDPRVLTDFGSEGAETPMWSPDGSMIVFAGYLGDGNNDVFVMEPDGSDQRRVTDGPGYDDHPHFSFDGRRIVFNSDRDSATHEVPWPERQHEIWSVALDGSDARKHTRCESVCTYGSLSPDGDWVLYRRVFAEAGRDWLQRDADSNSEIVIARADGSGERRVASSPDFDGWPRFSPDGDWIVFASSRGQAPLVGQIWRVRPDGSGLEQLTTGDWGHAQPSWSADGRELLAYRFQEFETAEYGGIARISISH